MLIKLFWIFQETIVIDPFFSAVFEAFHWLNYKLNKLTFNYRFFIFFYQSF